MEVLELHLRMVFKSCFARCYERKQKVSGGPLASGTLFEWAPRLGFSEYVVSWDGPVTHAKSCREEKRALKRCGAGVKIDPGGAAKGGCWDAAALHLCSWGGKYSRSGTSL